MRIPILLRGALVALIALFGVGLQSAHADSGSISLTILQGRLDHRRLGSAAGRSPSTASAMGCRLAASDYGLVFGGSKTVLHGRVSNIRRPSDVAGVYGAAGAGLAVGRRGAGDRAAQRKGRGAGAVRPAGRADGERGPERACDHAEVDGRPASARNRKLFDAIIASRNPPTLRGLETEPEADTGAEIGVAIAAIIAVGPIVAVGPITIAIAVVPIAVIPIAVVPIAVVPIAVVPIAVAPIAVVAVPYLLNDTSVCSTLVDGR